MSSGPADPRPVYRVEVTREGDRWLAEVPELDRSRTFAGNLVDLDTYVREVIVLGADLSDDAIDSFDLVYVDR